MATTISGSSSLKINTNYQSAGDLATAKDPLSITKTFTFTNGEGANKAEAVFHDTRTLASSATEDLDLAGSLTDAFGNTLTFTKVKEIYISAATGNTNNVEVGGAASNQFLGIYKDATDISVLRPGAWLAWCVPDATGMTVTAGTADLLKVANSAAGSSVSYDIVVIGETA